MFLHLSVILFTRGSTYPPPVCRPPKILWDTVNKRAVRILLECILVTRMHSSKMRTASSSSHIRRSLHQPPPRARHHPTLPLGPCTPTPDQAPLPRTRHPPTRHHHTPPGPGTLPQPGTPHGSGTPPVNGITHACENITLPQLRCGR